MMKEDHFKLSIAKYEKVLFQSHETVAAVCYPFFKKSPINYFDYSRFYDSGEFINFSTAPIWSKQYYAEKLMPSYQELKLFCDNKGSSQRYTFLSHIMEYPPGAADANPLKYEHNISLCAQYKIYHRIYRVDRIGDFFRVIGFGSTKEKKSIFNYYINNIRELEKFIQYFEKKAFDPILGQNNTRVIVPDYLSSPSLIDVPSKKKKKTDLTNREIQCLDLIAHGYTMKYAANKLDISARTVETHLRNIKEKLDVFNKNQLIQYWYEHFNS